MCDNDALDLLKTAPHFVGEIKTQDGVVLNPAPKPKPKKTAKKAAKKETKNVNSKSKC